MSDDWQPRQLFEQCVDHHAEALYRVAYRLTSSHDLADELVQETYLNAWKNLDSLIDHNKIRGWIFAILRNQYSKLLRKLPKTVPSPTPIEELALIETKYDPRLEAVQWAIAQLSDDQRLPILLVAMEGLSVDEAAEILSIPRGTVLSRMHRGREKLRKWLEHEIK